MTETTLKQDTVTKVPLTMQINNTDCGAASLNMILAYFGKWVSLSETREVCGVSRGGANAATILKAGQKYGLIGKGLRFSAEGLQKKGSFPCILFWDSCHFLVLRGFRENIAFLNDPAQGSISLPMMEFEKHYSGICLCFEPGPDFQPGGKRKKLLSVFVSKLCRRRLSGVLVVLVLLLSALAVLYEGAGALAERFFLDYVLIPENASMYRALLFIMLIVLSARFLTSLTREIVGKRIRAVIDAQESTDFMQKLFCLPLGFFEHRTVGDLLTRLKETSRLTDQMISILSAAVLYATGGIVYIIAMLRYSIPLTVIGAASIIINFLACSYAGRQQSNYRRMLQQDACMLISSTVSGFETIGTIKANGAEEFYFQSWAGRQARAHNSLCRTNHLACIYESLPELITMLSNALIILLGSCFIIKGAMSIGSLIAFFSFFQLLLVAARTLLFNSPTEEIRILLERKEEVMAASPDPGMNYEPKAAAPLQPLEGEIRVNGVSFAYDPLSPPFIKDFNLTVKAGAKVALVGPSGCGKSMILRLIGGLDTPWTGEILFDGKKRSDYDRYVCTGSIGMVFNRPILFEGTIADNLRMWDETIDRSVLEKCAKETGVHKVITRKKNGYNALLSASSPFSYGELQRMELARTLAQDPSILLLDEATSAFDVLTEEQIMQNIKKRHLTMIVATQRVTPLQDYDEILVLDRGKVIERGTYDELIRLGGRFAEYAAFEKGETSDESDQ